ncbi:hypothetical protein CANINC_004232 [Pichia inconspicua]|uniref:Signal peptidase complex subunit 2 n=1 Tax=Pichia inconspicua TaxID=52247 RepID=A0A4T0WXS5_9ASCO|nr:hypothetical protein CANINC_004232 [[Candida] inconspicua]
MKTEADEHIADVLESIGFSESHRNLDTKLVLGYTSVALAGLMYYLEKKFKNNFNNSSYVFYLQLLVGSYFTLQTILYLFTKFVEKNIKYIGYKKGKKITVRTSTPSKTDLLYEFTIEIDGAQHKLSFPLNEVFFDDGYLSLEAFKNKVIPIVQSRDKSK